MVSWVGEKCLINCKVNDAPTIDLLDTDALKYLLDVNLFYTNYPNVPFQLLSNI